ncbi:MAG: PQQ-binding-like beta-propeller repeat protein, partial [Acidobacteria bacterium]|nr:PQQ-binding-like beta-propeller repeat protein [Acidobacteriota bacterium]NIM60947.1 PQQ-binding-like beta-propeller repeat protein [Acidobacteriota bacterium]NIO58015.1 PQQ-binding-like beta-propeller repeat protein [Acidobacteriota bacterium]NIQ29022.1 PQQ-binding-like beta-propeller repeat protein [Acidobacteriota bacterium]NIQ83546.1 PQQ-binding-like beta-propeller repeat protein [Acidobacteriota bacterium]
MNQSAGLFAARLAVVATCCLVSINSSDAYAEGTLAWERSFPGIAQAVETDSDRFYVGGKKIEPVTPSIDLVFFMLRAYDPDTGQLLWEIDESNAIGTRLSGSAVDVATDETGVYVGGDVQMRNSPFLFDYTVRAYDAATGTLRWEDQTGVGGRANSISVADGLVFTAGLTGTAVMGTLRWVVRTYDADTGALVWEDNLPGVANSVAVHGGRVYVAGSGTHSAARAYEASTGALIWEHTGAAAGPAFHISVRGSVVLVAGTGGVYALDRVTGNLAWSRTSGLQTSIAVQGNRACVAGFQTVTAFDARSGADSWQEDNFPTYFDSVEARGNRCFALGLNEAGFSGTLRAYEFTSGEKLWEDGFTINGKTTFFGA